MQVLKWFIEKYTTREDGKESIISAMKRTSHHIDEHTQSPYHVEGDVYTHTLMAYSHVKDPLDIELKLAVLCHDIGKPACAKDKIEKGRVGFSGHEAFSSFMALEVLEEYEKDFNVSLNKPLILLAINWHSVLQKLPSFNEEENYPFLTDEALKEINLRFGRSFELYTLTADLAMADNLGRISVDYKISIEKQNLLQNIVPTRLGRDETKECLATMLCGIHGSGKSETARKILQENPKTVLLSVDDILMETLNPNGYTYNQVWTKDNNKAAFETLVERLKEAVDNKQSVVLDLLNIDEKIQRRLMSLIPDKIYHKRAITHTSTRERIFARNKDRRKEGKELPKEVILSAAKSFEFPYRSIFDSVKIVIT